MEKDNKILVATILAPGTIFLTLTLIITLRFHYRPQVQFLLGYHSRPITPRGDTSNRFGDMWASTATPPTLFDPGDLWDSLNIPYNAYRPAGTFSPAHRTTSPITANYPSVHYWDQPVQNQEYALEPEAKRTTPTLPQNNSPPWSREVPSRPQSHRSTQQTPTLPAMTLFNAIQIYAQSDSNELIIPEILHHANYDDLFTYFAYELPFIPAWGETKASDEPPGSVRSEFMDFPC
ncbi:hypothetical protein EDD85DRAFT_1007066 [Armillaria nabsnona]|nr:hypothetical protein EDD85DRAFT_1007066 [Armillaria nabsnona]